MEKKINILRPRRLRRSRKKKLFIAILIVLFLPAFFYYKQSFDVKTITLVRDGLEMELSGASASIADFLNENDIDFYESDLINPHPESMVVSGMRVEMIPSKKVFVKGPEGEGYLMTQADTVGDLLEKIGYKLSATKRVRPEPDQLIENDLEIELISYDEETEKKLRSIPYDTKYQTNSEKPFGYSAVVQEGERGEREDSYLIVYENGSLVSRDLVDSIVVKEPVTQIIEKGSKIVAGQSLGQTKASYYADFFHGRTTANGETFYNDRLTAAHKSLPFGTLVRVTNMRNSKSIVVPINDRGPYVDGREIDLSKAAFAAIAPLSNGVIPIELEIVQ